MFPRLWAPFTENSDMKIPQSEKNHTGILLLLN